MRLTFCLIICLVQILLIANAMEERDRFEFFTSVRLPFSVKRDEIINVPVMVHNVVHYEIQVAITLDNTDAEYENIGFYNKVVSEPKLTKSIRVRANTTATVSFLIRPKVIGKVMLIFRVSSLDDFDITHQIMNVVSEGITQYGVQALLVDLKQEPEHKSAFELLLPENSVPDSQHVEVGVVGDIMGLVLKNVYHKVRTPTGRGEQIMSSLLLNYLVLKYLMKSKRLTPTMEMTLGLNLVIGYQNMLNCRHMDGSFSSFGPSRAEENGFTWLTASVLRFLPKIKEFVNVNETIIEEGLAYLSKQQTENGTYTEKGDYLYPSQRNYVALTGEVVLAFVANPAYADTYYRNATKGLGFIGKNIAKYKSLYALLLATYARAKEVATEQINLIKWLPETKLANHSKWWHYVFLSDDEINSYNLLMLLDLKSTKIDYVIPVVKRLIVQPKSPGGFASDKDKIVCLTALLNIADFADYEPAKMNLNILSKDKNETIKLTENNGISYKSVELPAKTKSFKIAAKGSGSALVQIAYQYNVFKDQKVLYPSFTIETIKADNKRRSSNSTISVCVTYVGEGESSNMALLEIYTPSGYIIDYEYIKEIQRLKTISHVELKNSGSLLAVYFDHLDKNVGTCLSVDVLRTHAVAMQKPAPILIYDYYNEDRRAIASYEVDVNLCDICGTPEECSKCK